MMFGWKHKSGLVIKRCRGNGECKDCALSCFLLIAPKVLKEDNNKTRVAETLLRACSKRQKTSIATFKDNLIASSKRDYAKN